MTAAERKAAERARKRALGLVPVEVWILPESKSEVAAIVERDRQASEPTNPK